MKKKLILIVILLFFTFGTLYSCAEGGTDNNNEIVLSLNENVITWNEYKGAVSYNVYANGLLIETVKDTRCELMLAEGTYKIKVSANIGSGFSDFSESITYISDGSSEKIDISTLRTPVISLNSNVVRIEEVPNAISYDVYVDNAFKENITSLNYSLEYESGNHEVYVIAIGDHKYFNDSKKSNTVVYSVLETTSQSGTIMIFEINDTHGAAITDESYSGLDRVQSVIKSLEPSYGNILKIANGDLFQGAYVSNVTCGKIFIDALNEMNFDCFVIGNHEFDWGLDKIAQYKDGDLSNGEANFPFLGANIVETSTGKTPDFIDDYAIFQKNGLKIGVIGVIGMGQKSSIATDKMEGYNFVDETTIVPNLAKKLRTEENCDVVIVSTHDYTSSTNSEFASYYGDERIDAIVCAHTHQSIAEYETRKDGYQIPVVQSYTKNGNVGSIEITLNEGNISSTNINHYYPSSYEQDIAIKTVLDKYNNIVAEGNEVVGYFEHNMDKNDLGAYSCNAMCTLLDADFGFINKAGVRATVSAGEVLRKNIYDVFPFDNKIVVMTIKGSDLMSMSSTFSSLYCDDNYDSSSIVSSKTYKVCIIDFVFTGSYFQRELSKYPTITYVVTENYIRDAIFEALKNS